MTTPPHTAALLRQLRSDDYRERLQAVRRLGDSGDASVVASLGRMLDDTSMQVREAAAQALGEVGGTAAVPWLLCASVDRERRVKSAATAALKSTWDRADVKPLIEAFGRKPRRARAIVRTLARQGVTEPLMRLFDAGDARTRDRGMIGLTLADHLHGTALLTTALAGADSSIRARAATVLGEVRGIAAVSPLRVLLRDDEPWVRDRAANALGGIGAPAGIALVELQERGKRDGWFYVRWACRRAARRIRDALRDAPSEPEAASAPEGTGMELEAAHAPEGSGTEPIADDVVDDEEPEPRERPWWMFWRP